MNKNKLFKKNLLLSTMGFIAFGLISCGGNDDGDKGGNNVQMSGAVADDYIAFARVYIDADNNGRFNSEYETYAYTDQDGYFSIAKDGTNYCNLNPRQYKYRYCLKADEKNKNGGVIRVEGGRDLLTTQTYKASMSLLMNGTLSGLAISPLTSGDEAINNAALIKAAKSALGLTDLNIETVQTNYALYLKAYLNSTNNFNLNTYDPLEFGDGAGVHAKKNRGFKLAVQLHKIAESMAKELTPTSTPVGKKELAEKDLMPAIYFSLVYELITLNSDNSYDLFKDDSWVTNSFSNADSILTQQFSGYTFEAATGNITELSSYLNCVLSGSDTSIDIASNDTEYTSAVACSSNAVRSYNTEPSRKAKLYAAELGTDMIRKKITAGADFRATLNLAKPVAFSLPEFVASANDFSTSSNNIVAGNPPAAETTLSFDNGLLIDKYFDFNDSTDTLLVNFRPNDKVLICQSTSSGNEITEGTWQRDANKNYLIHIDYLGLPMTMKNLDPASCSPTSTAGSCLVIEFPDPSDPSKIKTTTKTSPNPLANASFVKPQNEFNAACGINYLD